MTNFIKNHPADFMDVLRIVLFLGICTIMPFGCFLPFQVDEEYCKNNQHLIECFGGELVWNEATNNCVCVCDEGKWGDRCQWESKKCKGEIKIDEEGESICSCENLPKCTSQFIFLFYDKYCRCKSNIFKNDNEEDGGIFFTDSFHQPTGVSKNLSSSDQDYFPLHIGQAWYYDILDTTGLVTDDWAMAVQDTFWESDVLYYDMLMAITDSLGEFEVVAGPLLFNSPDDEDQIHIRYSETQIKLFAYHQLPDTGLYVIDGDSIIIESIGQITVPAGTFDNCMAITDPITSTSFVYAPDVGLVKVINEGHDNMILTNIKRACALSATVSFTPVTCGNISDGTISLEINDESGILSYEWSGPMAIGNIPNPENLEAGSYSVTISDELCSVRIPEIIVQNSTSNLAISAITNNISCYGTSTGSIDISVSGGAGTLDYNWNDGLYMTEDLINLGAGSYTLVITDSTGCSTQKSFTISEADSLSIELLQQMDVSCKGEQNGSIEISVTGGTAPYSINWNNGQFNSHDLNGLSEGIYDLTVTDDLGCIAQKSFVIRSSVSDIPMKITVQGLLTDTANIVLVDGFYDLSFRIYSSFTSDSALWLEDQFDVSVNSGIFSTILGEFVPIDLCFDRAYFLGISIDGGSEMSPRIELTSSPYSFIAKSVDDNAITTSKVKDLAITPAKISVDVLSGINGVRNDGGDITLEAGKNIVITPNPDHNSITISSEGGNSNSSISVEEILPDIVSSINGVSNDGGNVNIVAGDNVSVLPNDSTNSIIISAEALNHQDSVYLDQIVPNVISSISGVTNDGGNVNIIGGENITVTSDDLSNSIIIDASDPGNGIPTSQFWQAHNSGISYTGDHVLLLRDDNTSATQMTLLNDGTGFIGSHGPNGTFNVQMTSLTVRPNNGYLSINNDEGITQAAMYIGSSENGVVFTNGANGNNNNVMSFLSEYPNHGYISANDAQGNAQTVMYVDANGNGRVYADFYDSLIDHPTKSNLQIRNTHLQGPEAGIYLRGTANLIEGSGAIQFPEYFERLISEDKITVMITPLSARSKGIAVVKKGVKGFKVQELLEGTGNYQFDWEVNAIRKGTENYKVLHEVIPGHNKVESPNQIRSKNN